MEEELELVRDTYLVRRHRIERLQDELLVQTDQAQFTAWAELNFPSEYLEQFPTDDEILDDLIRELEMLESWFVAEVVAEVDAAFLTDFLDRFQSEEDYLKRRGHTREVRRGARADPIHRKLKALFDSPGRATLDDILDVWVTSPDIENHLVSQFRRVLRARHWIAHGRPFMPDFRGLGNPDRVFQRSQALLQAFLSVVDEIPPLSWKHS